MRTASGVLRAPRAFGDAFVKAAQLPAAKAAWADVA